MSHLRYIDSDKILVTELFGDVTIDEIKGLQDELPEYLSNDELFEIVIHKKGLRMNLNSQDAITSADNVRRSMKDIKKAAIAFVSNEDFIFGLRRQLEIRSENDFVQMCVFRSEEAARSWFDKIRSKQLELKENGSQPDQ